MTNWLFEFTVKVRRGPGCDLPPEMAGAFVTSYAAAVDVQAAIAAAVAKLRALDFIFEDIEGAARELPAASWSTYVAAVWPDYTGRLPLQAELTTLIGRGDTG